MWAFIPDNVYRQVRQGIATNTKGTAFVVYEDVMDAKQACDKLNGFNFQNRYLVGMFIAILSGSHGHLSLDYLPLSLVTCSRPFRVFPRINLLIVLYHQPEKMAKSREDLDARREALMQLKKQHGID
jgi:pre-mRNA branch site protein p14